MYGMHAGSAGVLVEYSTITKICHFFKFAVRVALMAQLSLSDLTRIVKDITAVSDT